MTRHDGVVLILIILVVLLAWVALPFANPEAGSSELVLEVVSPEPFEDQGLSWTTLVEEERPRQWTIQGKVGLLLLTYEPGEGLRLSEAECPNQLCLQMGPVHKAGQVILCAPNEVMIGLRQETDQGGREGFDAILQ